MYNTPMNLTSLKVGFFLAMRYIRRSNIWASILIVFIMTLTFLNVIVIRGILVGLPEGVRVGYKAEYSADVIITAYPEKRYIERSRFIENILPTIEGYERHSSRYVGQATLEANYNTSRKASELPDAVAVQVVGIDPQSEDNLTHLSDYIIEGEFLTPGDTQGIVLGHQLLERHTLGPFAVQSLKDVFPGSKIRVVMDDGLKEFTVRGIIRSKIPENHSRAFILDTELRNQLGRSSFDVNEIAIAIAPGTNPQDFKQGLLLSDLSQYGVIETAVESQGAFIEDIQSTFEILSAIIGFIGIVVASITVFIVVFIFAINRQKQIGILKGIGINRYAIESSYIMLSIFYALCGIAVGSLLLNFVIAPQVAANPIDFPFADGLLVAPFDDTLIRSLIIIGATIFAGYIPSRIIVNKNTLNAILGR